MKKVFILFLVLIMVSTMIIGCSNENSDDSDEVSNSEDVTSVEIYDGEPITMKLAWAETADPNEHPVSAAFTVFKSTVEQLTNGKLIVELYPAGQLGDAKSMIEQVDQGIIQSCASIPSGMIAGSYYDNFNIFDVPYLFRSSTIAWETLNPSTEFFNEISSDMASVTGIRPLGLFMEGSRHFTNSVREIKTPADMEGLKIRTMEVPAHMEMVKALGASPTPVSWLELYSALQTGVVDGQENPIFNIQYLKGHEVQDYLTLDGHIFLLNAWVVNEAWYSELPDSIKLAMKEAVDAAILTSKGMADLANTVGIEDLKDKGMKVYTPTAEELNEFREVTQSAVIPWVEENVSDPSWITKLNDAIEEAENYYKK
ncbi:MAG: DctP family TRAP transporter solute-binding subunit [Eubacteriales bacterium]